MAVPNASATLESRGSCSRRCNGTIQYGEPSKVASSQHASTARKKLDNVASQTRSNVAPTIPHVVPTRSTTARTTCLAPTVIGYRFFCPTSLLLRREARGWLLLESRLRSARLSLAAACWAPSYPSPSRSDHRTIWSSGLVMSHHLRSGSAAAGHPCAHCGPHPWVWFPEQGKVEFGGDRGLPSCASPSYRCPDHPQEPRATCFGFCFSGLPYQTSPRSGR
jgi:hypothetical protein